MKKADFIVMIIVIAVAGILFFALYGTGNHGGNYIQIEVNGSVSEVLPLSENAQKAIITEHGSNTLEIKDGKAKMTDADCPDKICVHHSSISRAGESIICLPHKVVVTVIAQADDAEIDAVVG